MTRSYSVRRLVPLVLVLPLLLGGCGGDEKKDDEKDPKKQAYAQKELAAGLYEDRIADDAADVISTDDADCIAEELLDTFGIEGLGMIGVLGPDGTWNESPGKLKLEDGERWIGAFDTCLDMRQYLWGLVSSALLLERPDLRQKPAAVWSAAQKCVLDGVTEPQATSALLGEAIDSDAVSAADGAVTDCIRPLIG